MDPHPVDRTTARDPVSRTQARVTPTAPARPWERDRAHGEETKALCPWGLPPPRTLPLPCASTRSRVSNASMSPGEPRKETWASGKGSSGCGLRGGRVRARRGELAWGPEKHRPRWVWVPLSLDQCGLVRSPSEVICEHAAQICASLGSHTMPKASGTSLSGLLQNTHTFINVCSKNIEK